MNPKFKKVFLMLDDFGIGKRKSLTDALNISKVDEVMHFFWCRKKLRSISD